MKIERITLQHLVNTRDLGGFKTADGKTIRPRRLIRSGHLCDLSQHDADKLTQEYDLRTIVDFRTEQERRETPDTVPEGVLYVENPILEDLAVGVTRDEESKKNMVAMMLANMGDDDEGGQREAEKYMTNLYRSIIQTDFSRKQYRRFFDILLAQEEGAVLWHCSAGKDRVGVGTALLLSALGVPREVILQDYMMVNEFTADSVNAELELIAQKVKDVRVVGCIRSMLSVKECYLESVFEYIEQEAGSVDAFLEQEMGLDSQRLEQLRRMYLE